MLTRLRVEGFKNLVDVDVRFGPFTCIAGPNGVGKSNAFDAIQLLSLLADHPLLDAARRIRGGSRLRNLFHRTGDEQVAEMLFEAEMIVPRTGRDDLGQEAIASSTFLRYRLRLSHRPQSTLENVDRLEILEEGLEYITKGEAHKHVLFDHSARAWRDSVIINRKYGESFISTQHDEEGRTLIRLHQDGGGSRGRPLSYLASSLPRTVLSSTNAAESPTALLARREMQSWRLIQLEPSALRKSDSFTDPTHLGSDGSHLAGALYRLGNGSRPARGSEGGGADGGLNVYAEVANRLATFLDDVREVSVDRDEKRELLTVEVRTVGKSRFPAAALSDGTLRFLALAVFEIDPEATGVLCLEEPENGVHPARVPSMLSLLRRIAVDPYEPVDPENPLRQVIVSTHSPAVVQQVPEDTLLLASPTEHYSEGVRRRGVVFRHLRDTWRERSRPAGSSLANLGDLLTYLSPSLTLDAYAELVQRDRPKRVVDRGDVQRLLPFAGGA